MNMNTGIADGPGGVAARGPETSALPEQPFDLRRTCAHKSKSARLLLCLVREVHTKAVEKRPSTGFVSRQRERERREEIMFFFFCASAVLLFQGGLFLQKYARATDSCLVLVGYGQIRLVSCAIGLSPMM